MRASQPPRSMVRSALDALDRVGVPFATRGEQPIDDPPPGGDIDLLIAEADAEAADRAMHAAGFRHLHAPGHRGHRFYLVLDCERGQWLKVDIALVPDVLGWDLSARDQDSMRRFAGYRVGTKAPGRGLVERASTAVALRRPAAARRLGPVVAVLGPDGAGKGTVIASLDRELPVRVTPVYLGYGGASRREYTRRPPAPDLGQARRRLKGAVSARLDRLPPTLRELEWRSRHLALAILRMTVAYAYAWRGDVVVCDRHPIEHLGLGSPVKGLPEALERAVLRRLPRPDSILLLDAPVEILHERKREHPPSALERLQTAYREQFADWPTTTVIPTDGRLEDTVAAAIEAVWRSLVVRRRW